MRLVLLNTPYATALPSSALLPLKGHSSIDSGRIAHVQVKPDNIIIMDGPGGELIPKLIDVGIARSADPDRPMLGTSARGCEPYMSPEQFDATENIYKSNWDVYSYGMVLNEMVVGEIPWLDPVKKVFLHDIEKRVKAGERPRPTVKDRNLGKLIDRCWNKDPEKRPDMQAVVAELEMMIDTAVSVFVP